MKMITKSQRTIHIQMLCYQNGKQNDVEIMNKIAILEKVVLSDGDLLLLEMGVLVLQKWVGTRQMLCDYFFH